MIKRILILSVVRFICATLTVGAATVTPSSPSNYLFSTPLYPAHIRGEVMGTPPAYRVPRSEDVDWIAEAYGERRALGFGEMPAPGTSVRPEFGKWPLSETNRFYRWATAVDVSGVTNIVVGYNIVTNDVQSPFSIDTHGIKNVYRRLDYYLYYSFLWNPTSEDSYFLDPTAPTSGVARVAPKFWDTHSFTNTYLSPTVEGVPTNSFSTIEMPMTNGTVSVYTNQWGKTRWRPVYFVITNVATTRPLDYCHAGAGQFPGYTNSMNSLGDLGFRPGVFSNLYNTLRCATRLADTTGITGRSERVNFTHRKYSDKDNTIYSTDVTTNTETWANYSFSADGQDAYSWDGSGYAKYDCYWVRESITAPYEAVAQTRFKSDLVTTGAAQRVTIEAAFAVVSFSYDKGVFIGGPPNWESEYEVYIDNHVVVPLATYALDLSGEYALARVRVDIKSLLSQAARASGAPQPPANPAEYVPPDGEFLDWVASCEQVVLIYKLHPSSKFDEWD